ncbi:MAG: CDP-alcohol phosphatidyltransferase family protein [Vicinamibacterales bacterium]
MSRTPHQRALLRRTTLALCLIGTGGFQGARLVQVRLGLDGAYPVSVVLVFAAAAALVLASVASQHPFTRFGPANGVTSVRLMLTSLVAGLALEGRSDGVSIVAATVALVATLLDGLDGWLARRTGLASAFGARFDMETDALLILVLAVVAWQHDRAGGWIVLAGAMRYLFVLAGYGWAWMNAPLPASQRRKAVCVVQIVGLGLIVSPLMAPPVSIAAAAITLILLTWSFGVDVRWLYQHRGMQVA